ncbi:unnamed protein product [Symbiodinium natans]|uniref:Uncharacterized protein n=1 Tax=Symbiodinium natans TaxID=878477 RepID=A0A812PN90_9DINO|nr:unnamed protein product [Symbiodinium natans]
MPLRAGLFYCAGIAGKMNWLLVRHVPSASRYVVFFPGDISDFANKHAPYSYSLEGLLWVLCSKYPDDTVVLVKPRMMLDHFAIYANFMMVDGMGNPRHLSDKRNEKQADASRPDEYDVPASGHLRQLLSSLGKELGEEVPSSLVLVGFSKGAAVLNALMRDPEESLWSAVRTVHFVDAGLAIPGVFPLGEQELQKLNKVVPQEFEIWLHCTPRQVEDESRPFVAHEHDAFEAKCKALGVAVQRRMYAAGLPVSLDMHFDALRCFVTSREDQDGGDRRCGFFQAWRAVAEAADDDWT